MKYHDILSKLEKWIASNSDVTGLAIVGSYARGEQKEDSDVDICIFTSHVRKYIENTNWLNNFGEADKIELENWGVVDTVRAYFSEGTELEFNFSDLSWANIPVDSGTYRVISDGIQILYDPYGALLRLQRHVEAEDEKLKNANV